MGWSFDRCRAMWRSPKWTRWLGEVGVLAEDAPWPWGARVLLLTLGAAIRLWESVIRAGFDWKEA